MEKIGTLIQQRAATTKPKKSGGVNSVFNAAVARFLEEIKDSHAFGYWCGRLRGVPPRLIHEWTSKCREARKPIALFQHLLKQYRAEVKAAKKISTDIPHQDLTTKLPGI